MRRLQGRGRRRPGKFATRRPLGLPARCAAAAIRQADALATTAEREGLPNLVARGVSEPVDDGDSRVFRPGFGITIPIFNRNRGRVQALRATTRQAELGRNALVETIGAKGWRSPKPCTGAPRSVSGPSS